MLSFEYNRTSNVIVDVNVKNHNFIFPLILDDKYNIMKVMQNLKFRQEFYFCYQCGVA